MYHYRAYGISIASELYFPELVPDGSMEADISIRLGTVPRQLAGEGTVRGSVSMNAAEYLHRVPQVAGVYITGGRSIRVEPYPGIDEQSIRILVLGISMAAVLYQRNLIPLHASAIKHPSGLVAFCGSTGAGKTTLVSALRAKGHPVFSDDVCVLGRAADGRIEASSSYPVLKTCEDTFDKLALAPPEEHQRLRPGFHKYARYFFDDFDTQPGRISRIFCLHCSGEEDRLSVTRLNPTESFQVLIKNAYKPGQVAGMKKEKVLFEIVSRLAADVPVYRVNRPAKGNSISNLVELVESHLSPEIKEA